MKSFLIVSMLVTLAIAQIPTFPNFPSNFDTTARPWLPPMEPMVPNFPIFPTAPTMRPQQPTSRPQQPPIVQSTARPQQPIPPSSNNNGRPPLANGNWRPGMVEQRCPLVYTEYPVYLADPSNCRRFYICNAGYAWPMSCPPSVTNNVIWSQSDNVCREVENARC